MPGAETNIFIGGGVYLLVAALFFALAALYSSVGHGGGSGYLAVMALFGMPVEIMKPAALALNILVASLTTFRFHKAGYLAWPDIWPLVLLSIPLAFAGGAIQLPGDIYRPLVGSLLLASAAYLVWGAITEPDRHLAEKPRLPRVPALGVGGALGFLAGLTGIGGGVFLSPVMLILRWTSVRRTAAVAACFILFNSTAGLAGSVITSQQFPLIIPLWAAAAVVGGYVGSKMGSQLLPPKVLIWILSLALTVAGAKFVLT